MLFFEKLKVAVTRLLFTPVAGTVLGKKLNSSSAPNPVEIGRLLT